MAETLISEFDDKEVRSFINELIGKTKTVKSFGREYIGLLSAIVYADVINHFQQEQGSEGPWAKWSQGYREQMKKKGRSGNKILQDTGRLRQNFSPSKNRKTSSGILWFNNAKSKDGRPYAAEHDQGFGRIPKRDFMWLSDGALEKITYQTLQFLIDKGV